MRTLYISDLKCFETFRNCWVFLHILALAMMNFFQIIISDIARIVYIKFNVFFKLFEIAVCFAHFGFYEIGTPLMFTTLTMTNIV